MKPGAFEQSLQAQLPGIIQALGQFGQMAQGEATRLLGQGRQIPQAIDIAKIFMGQSPEIQATSNNLIGNTVRQAEGQIGDFVNRTLGGHSVSAAVSGGGGTPTAGRRVEGVNAGARSIGDVLLGASTQFNPIAIGSSVGQNLLGNLEANQRQLGNLFQIGSSIFGGISDINARELGRLSNIRLAASPRSTTTSQFGLGGEININDILKSVMQNTRGSGGSVIA